MKNHGHPKGSKQTVVGLPKKRKRNENRNVTAFSLKPAKEVEEIILKWFVPNDIARKAVTDSFQICGLLNKNADVVSSAVTDTDVDINLEKKHFTRNGWNCLKKVFAKKLKNPLYIGTVVFFSKTLINMIKVLCATFVWSAWYHVTCGRLKNPPKSKIWFC